MFGKRLLMARKQKGLTLEKLAEIYNERFNGNLSKGTLSKYENGKQEPMISTVGNLALILDASVDFLIGDENKDSDNSKEKQIFSKKLNFYMDKKGITQADIVSKFGITASTVSDWCNGKKYPRSDKVRMLANFLGVLKSDLVEDSPLEEGTLIFNRNGEIIRKKFSEEQMKYLEKFISSLTDEDYPDL